MKQPGDESIHNFWNGLQCPKCPGDGDVGKLSPALIANQVHLMIINHLSYGNLLLYNCVHECFIKYPLSMKLDTVTCISGQEAGRWICFYVLQGLNDGKSQSLGSCRYVWSRGVVVVVAESDNTDLRVC